MINGFYMFSWTFVFLKSMSHCILVTKTLLAVLLSDADYFSVRVVVL